MMNEYYFITEWQTSASLQHVWNMLIYSIDHPCWWESFYGVQQLHCGNEHKVGGIWHYELRGNFPYTLSFSIEVIQMIEYSSISGLASGDLSGTGTLVVNEVDGQTRLRCEWKVTTQKLWMRFLSFLLKPFFVRNHIQTMEYGAYCMSRQLGFPVRSISRCLS